jgi:hypothetical protein
MTRLTPVIVGFDCHSVAEIWIDGGLEDEMLQVWQLDPPLRLN